MSVGLLGEGWQDRNNANRFQADGHTQPQPRPWQLLPMPMWRSNTQTPNDGHGH